VASYNLVFQPGGKAGQLLDPPPHRFGDVERVRAGVEDVETDGRVEVIGEYRL
jgi:hypothetical protein